MGGMVNLSANAFAGSYSVLISNPQNSNVYLTNGFTVNGSSSNASLLSVTPNSTTQGQNLTVTITGANTHFASGSNTLRIFKQGTESFDDIFEIGNQAVNNNVLTSNIIVNPNATVGIYTIGVQNDMDGLLLLNNSFIINQNNKSISVVNPNSGKQGQTLNVTLTGINTNFTSGSSTFIFLKQGSETTDLEVINTTTNSATEAVISVQISPNCPIGLYDLGYFNPSDGVLIRNNAFNVEMSTGIKELNQHQTLLFPNPAKNKLFIDNINGVNSIEICDLTGKIIFSKQFEKETTKAEINLEEATLGKGIYFVKTQNQFGQEIKKLLID
jgi:hypothetical protein